MTHGDLEATVQRLLNVSDQAFAEIVVAESRARAGDDVVAALRHDWELCNRWVEALTEKSKQARDRLSTLEAGSKAHNDTRYFLSKIDRRCRAARTRRSELERDALLGIIEEMDCLLFDAVGEGWPEGLSDDTYEAFERFVP